MKPELVVWKGKKDFKTQKKKSSRNGEKIKTWKTDTRDATCK